MWRAVTPLCRVHFSNPCSANHNCLSAWYERELVLLHPGQLKWGSETISFCCLLCGKRKQHWCEKIFLRNFILHFREPLCFKSWLLLQVEERTKPPIVYQVYLKKTLIFISNLFICMCFNIFLDLPSFILKEFGRE